MGFAQGHALLIGVGTYQVAKWNAPVTVGDAAGVQAALTDQAVAGYPADQVTLLHDEGATLNAVRTALDALARRVTDDDVVLIFYAGHGVIGDDGQYTLTTHDTKFSPGGKALQGTGLGEVALLEHLRAVQAGKLLLAINACLSGHVHATLGHLPTESTLGAPPTAALSARVLGSGEGRAVVTAARATQSSYYRPKATTTVFGEALIGGLRGAGMSGPGYVGLFELYEYLYTTVTTEAAKIGGEQEPVLNLAQGVGPFPVAFYPGTGARWREALGPPAITQAAPEGMAVETFPTEVIDAYRGNVTITFDQSRRLISFDGAHIGGGVNVGDVAEGDIIKITVTPAAAAAVNTAQQLLARIDDARTDLGQLRNLPKGAYGDIDDSLRHARQAGEDGDRARLLDKLELAQTALVGLAGSVPGAIRLSDAVGILLQQARVHS